MVEKIIIYLYYKGEKTNLLIKIILSIIILLIIINIIYIDIDHINLVKNINNNFFKIMDKIKSKNINLNLNPKITNIENIFILIEIMPFIKRNIIIKKYNNNKIFQLCKKIFKDKKESNIIIINQKDFYYFKKNFYEIVNYKWEIVPNITLINELRYLIQNYYNEICLEIFDSALNLNVNNYIQINKNFFSFEDIKYLMSKFIIYLYFN